MDNIKKWNLEDDFKRLVIDLKKRGMSDDDAKAEVKRIMNNAADIVTGNMSLVDALKQPTALETRRKNGI